ncbi:MULTISPECIES: Hsp20/alpha crystallin family protein [unclassified Chelatococcus]|uniref:Hsp20/alpha crystallin family protein n=1 Tax=unclassified Chelatococcus TaxID=2638111 RepID=UPI001BCBF883|nr:MULTISPECIES: Hsp20/alpha crystallin family protein [unclassified Chelatococcus]MBS7700880.1 Hsp20/alpha crystallin family protein [Chelatococcus sp. YT9]MBX3555413.1 Hsp20/alpha crystallin family protein [Chelatococcus sp.]
MKNRDLKAWMWSDAVEMLARAERMHRDLFRPAAGAGRMTTPQWEPPVDVLETDHELRVLAALPGVDPDHIQVSIANGVLIIAGERVLPPELRTATIHRLELPQGRFERQLQLPTGRYEVGRPSVINGCLLVVLRKLV